MQEEESLVREEATLPWCTAYPALYYPVLVHPPRVHLLHHGPVLHLLTRLGAGQRRPGLRSGIKPGQRCPERHSCSELCLFFGGFFGLRKTGRVKNG